MSTGTWTQRLDAIRRATFTGREAERNLFLDAVLADDPSTFVLYFYGPGGIGKTTLLRQLAYAARQHGVAAHYLDARNIDPSPDAFVSAVDRALGSAPDERAVLLLDTFELLRPLEEWLRAAFLPTLPQNVRVVVAGRTPPAPAWREDPAWQTLMRVQRLHNLSAQEARSYLAKRAIPDQEQESILAFTRGHPLALSLVADLLAHEATAPFAPGTAGDVISVLVERLAQEAPAPAYRTALEASALVRVTTESLLEAMLDSAESHAIFRWLRELSLMDAGAEGVFPHDLAREAILRDLRWRDPDRYATLHRRARDHYLQHLAQFDARGQRRLLFDLIYLHRENPMTKPYFEWQTSGTVYTDRATPDDFPAVVAMVRRFEGEESAELARYWIERHPEGVAVIRQTGGDVAGALISIAVERTSAADRARDPAVDRLWAALQQTPLLPHETATCFRFWLARDGYQAVSPVQSRLFLNMVQHYLTTPGLALTFLPCADPDFWAPFFAYGDQQRRSDLDFTVGGRRYGVYGHDWRAVSPLAWLTLVGDREISAELAQPAPPPPAPVRLSEAEFADAVRDALRHLHDHSTLLANPLVQSRLVAGRRGSDPAAALKQLLLSTLETLQHTPKQRKLHRAVYHTYVQPAPSQEAAAELLDVPFSTFRRHLRQGVEAITGQLWQAETGP